jgi:D-alanyl-D-alanine carboxypeptidase
LSKDDWRLILINKQHSIPDDYTFTFGTISTLKGTMKCDERIISDLLEMLQGAKDDGINLQICSPYRDMDRQVYLFDKKITTYMKQGMSYMDAYALTAQAVTVPGASEHQIGLALDIVSDSYAYLNEGFGETEAGKWLAEHGCEYGFILRYPKGKEYITGIEYEPWHFRYVGREAATIMTEEDLTLEEFVASLE